MLRDCPSAALTSTSRAGSCGEFGARRPRQLTTVRRVAFNPTRHWDATVDEITCQRENDELYRAVSAPPNGSDAPVSRTAIWLGLGLPSATATPTRPRLRKEEIRNVLFSSARAKKAGLNVRQHAKRPLTKQKWNAIRFLH